MHIFSHSLRGGHCLLYLPKKVMQNLDETLKSGFLVPQEVENFNFDLIAIPSSSYIVFRLKFSFFIGVRSEWHCH